MIRSILLLMTIAVPASGQSPPMDPVLPPPSTIAAVTLPKEISARAGRIARIEATSTGKSVRWAAADDTVDLVRLDDHTVLFCASAPGRYRLFAWTSTPEGPTEAASTFVVVAGLPPTPVPPPIDALADALRASLLGDTTPDRAKHLKTLAELYRQGAALAKTNPPATGAALLASIRAASATLLPADALKGLRAAVAARLSMVLPPTDAPTPLDDATRATANELFLRLAKILETLE